MGQATQTLSERLERLEQENSRIRRSARLTKIVFAAMGALFAGVATVPLANSKPPNGVPVVNAQQINLVNTSGKVLASLGTTADGNVLTFFDPSGKKTLTVGNSADGTSTGVATWDGNSILPGTGHFRATFAETNSSNPLGGGLAFNVWNDAGKARVAVGTTVDDTFGFIFTSDPNGSTIGIENNGNGFQNQGFFANDLNGKNRIFVGNSLDGTAPFFAVNDANNVTRASIGVAPDSAGFFVYDSAGTQEVAVGQSLSGNSAGIAVSDINGKLRAAAGWDSSNQEHYTLFDALFNVTFAAP